MAKRTWRIGWVILVGWSAYPLGAGTIPPADANPYQVIRAQRAVIRHGDSQEVAPAGLYDGSGLTHYNPLLAQHGSAPGTIWQYQLGPDEYPVSVEFDLGNEFLINEFWLWQLPGPELEDRGLGEFDIVLRDGGRREVGRLPGALDQFKRVGIQPVQRFNAFGECVFFPVPDCIRYIELMIYQNRGNSQWLGLAEVLFAGWAKPLDVPEPSSAGLIGLAVVGLTRRVRRQIGIRTSKRRRVVG